MRTHLTALALTSLLASACGFSHFEAEPEPEPEPEPVPAPAPDAGPDVTFEPFVCTPAFEDCAVSAACCSGYCSELGYGTGTCLPRQPDGAACVVADACTSRQCVDGTCGAPEPEECLVEGHPCGFGTGCCEGTECRFLSYGVSTCVVPLLDGAECATSAACASNRCADGVCRSAECTGESERCDADPMCCRGVCMGGPSDGFYGFGRCVDRLDAGASCVRDAWCESGSCVDGVCG